MDAKRNIVLRAFNPSNFRPSCSSFSRALETIADDESSRCRLVLRIRIHADLT